MTNRYKAMDMYGDISRFLKVLVRLDLIDAEEQKRVLHLINSPWLSHYVQFYYKN